MNLAFGRGLDQRAPETALAPGFVRDAVNLDIAPGQYAQKVPLGHARTRIGRTLAHASVAMRGGWCDARVPFALLVDGTALVALAEDGTRTTLATVTAGYGVCAEFVEAQGAVYWSNGIERGRIVAGVNVPWGLPEPAAPGLSATSGTLAPGTYLVAVTHVNAAGEEGGASPVATLALSVAGGISVTLPALPAEASGYRVYLGGPDADPGALYWAKDVTASTTLTAAGTPGRRLQTQYMRRMPAASVLTAWNGRMWAAVGSLLMFSTFVGGMPHYGLYDGRGGWLPMDATVTMIRPTADGIYVGTNTGVWFLSGDPAATMARLRVDGFGVLGSTVVPAGSFAAGQQTPDATADLPVWLSSEGDVLLGRPGGIVQRLGLVLAFAPNGPAALMYIDDSRGRRLIVSAPAGDSSSAAVVAPTPVLVGNGVSP